MTDHEVVSREEWQAASEELLRREKEHTRMADELASQRRALPADVLPLHVRTVLPGRMPYAPEQVQAWDFNEAMLLPIMALNAAATDVTGYLSEPPAASVFVLQDGAVYQTYAATARVEYAGR